MGVASGSCSVQGKGPPARGNKGPFTTRSEKKGKKRIFKSGKGTSFGYYEKKKSFNTFKRKREGKKGAKMGTLAKKGGGQTICPEERKGTGSELEK